MLPELPQDPLQETQASLFKIATGLSSVVRERARMYRVPLEQARTDVINDLAETKAVLGYIPQPPGVSGAGTTAPPERPARETGDQDEEDPNA